MAVPESESRGQAGKGRIYRVLAVFKSGKLKKKIPVMPGNCSLPCAPVCLMGRERKEYELSGSPGFALGTSAMPQSHCLALPTL